METELDIVIEKLRERIKLLQRQLDETLSEAGQNKILAEMTLFQSQLHELVKCRQMAFVGDTVEVSLPDGATFVSKVYAVVPGTSGADGDLAIVSYDGIRHAVAVSACRAAKQKMEVAR